MNARPQKVLVVSLDWDGCMFHMDYICNGRKNDVVSSNENIFKHIKNLVQEGQYTQIILMVGSNRQSQDLDIYNAQKLRGWGHIGLCYPLMESVRAKIAEITGVPCQIDDYLLADTFSDKPAGTSFQLSLSSSSSNGDERPVCMLDESKYFIIYAQLHRINHLYPNAVVDLAFYDDRFDILRRLNHHFSTHSDALPKGSSFFGMQYAGHLIDEPEFSLKGSGIVDSNYETHLLEIAKLLGITKGLYDVQGFNITQDLQDYVTEYLNLLENRIPPPLIEVNICMDANGEVKTIISPAIHRFNLFAPNAAATVVQLDDPKPIAVLGC